MDKMFDVFLRFRNKETGVIYEGKETVSSEGLKEVINKMLSNVYIMEIEVQITEL